MIGTTLAHYEITDKLGQGGMGSVWRARDTKLGREVAIKTLPDEFAEDADRVARFQREAKLLASLNHPNIAAIHGLEEADGKHFLVLELVEGDTIADRIKSGPIEIEEALRLALQIAEALEAAHDKGVVHRDLKPANIKITPDGKVKVLDFGLAKALTAETEDANLSQSPTLSMAATQQGVILGTASYMSPEQAKGRATDKRTDIWAFGCVLFEMMTGRQSFGASDVSEALAAVIRAEPEWSSLPANLHPRLREVLERCLEKDVKQRYHDVADVRVDIEKVLADPSGVIVQPVEEFVQAKSQSKMPWVAMFLLGLFVAGVAVWALSPAPEPEPVVRLAHVLPEGDSFTRTGRSLLAVSRDGTRIVYVANGQLYLRDLGELEARPIQGTDTDPSDPFFSPEGDWIGYWSATNQLTKIPVGGGVPIPLTDAAGGLRGPSWGVDETIVYISQNQGVMRVSANGGTAQVLIAGEGFRSPQILPNDYLLFSEGTAREGMVTVQSLDSEEPQPLFPGVSPEYVSTGHIVYQADNVLYAVPFDVNSLEVTGGPVALLQGVRGSPPQYAVSDSGSLVYVPGTAGGTDGVLALVDRDGNIEVLEVPRRRYVGPRLSADGARVAVEATDADESAIFVYDLFGNTVMRPLTQTSEGNNSFPLWTPDSERVTFTSDRDGTLGIYWQSADGTDVAEELFLAPEGTSFLVPDGWSSDGRTLVFSVGASGGEINLWTLSLDEGIEAEAIYDAPGRQRHGAFSADGNWLSYSSTEPGSAGIEVQPFPTTGRRFGVAVTDSRRVAAGIGIGPLWSADGTELFFQAFGPNRIVAVDVTTTPGFASGTERPLPVEGFLDAAPYRDYDMSPDGQRFLVAFPAGAGDPGVAQNQINIVLNWFTELRERVPVD